MIQTGEKLRVFISSKTGYEQDCIKYNLARKAIKEMLELTGLFQVYLFEEAGTSSTSAYNHYIQRLKSVDVCIFLIDNEDGVPQGVQNEVDEVLKNNIPSLYYFCDENSKEKTSLQKSLLHANAPKNKIIHSFEDFIQRGTTDLIDDILSVYRAYGSGNNIFPSNNLLMEETNDEVEEQGEEKNISIPHALLKGNKKISKEKCRNYFISMFYGNKAETEEISSSLDIDYYSSTFLQTMFEGRSFDSFKISEYLGALEKILPQDYFKVVKLRWKSISEYYNNNLSRSIEILKTAYMDSVSSNLEDWFIQDILIDLRNQINLYHENRNEFTDQNFGQIELDKMESNVFYPNIDRYERNLLAKLEQDRQKSEIEAYTSKTFLVDRTLYTNSIADIFFEAMIFGSMTHLIRLYSIVQKLSYEWFVRNDEWTMFKLNFKNTVMTLNKKSVHRMARTFSTYVEKFTQEEAKEVYDYTENQILGNQKLVAKLLAISELGYYLSDDDFSDIWGKLKVELNNWKDSEDSIVSLENYVFYALKSIKGRVEQNFLAEFCLSILKSKSVRYHDSAIEFLSKSVSYDDVDYTLIIKLNEYIIGLLEDGSSSYRKDHIEYLCCQLGKILSSKDSRKLNSKIQEKWPEFYKLEYSIETDKSELASKKFLEKQLETIKYRNKTQGQNGTYAGYADSPFLAIKNILSSEKTIFSQELVDAIFIETGNTILNAKQTVNDKIQAYKLLYALCRIDKDIISRNSHTVKQLIDIKEDIDAYESMLSYMQKQMLLLARYLLLEIFKKDVWGLILNELSSYDDEGSQIEACKLIKSYLENDGVLETSRNVLGLFFQFSLIWINSSSLDLRWHSVHLLIKLLKTEEYVETITNRFTRIINEDDSYVKSILVYEVNKIEEADRKTAEFILERSLEDSNYVIRKMASSKQLKK
ncbi:hypothetical protein IV468_02135 [Enterococcus casseliflavus]|uniref:hypothetical protein n=2 Tax=Enterococcus TaxID=1350 RepID=UPI0009BCAF3B|nr:hypothetical protein [Enterococcus casseliflavus]MCD5200578.1 hypothetical protein [Enterococcus casseliflavus]OQO87953.1 hypothetical protein BH748_01665 [Enterococcus casseliflavus]